jgi:hypothetical protein
MKAVCHRNRKQKCQDQQDAEVPFMRLITDITGTSPWRRNGNLPVGYLEQAALRREQCDGMAESQNSGTNK